MLAAMGLADFFRRHRNVFSISSKAVDVKRGDEDMLVEEYGGRAVEAERPAGWVGRGEAGLATLRPDVAEDELADEDQRPNPAS